MPKVSIVLPSLNNRQYLDLRLASIWDQTLDDWELIIFDSHSTDGAWEFFQECAKEDKRIRIYQSAEKGIYGNLNKCIEMAKGEYIYIATSDDTMEPTLLETMLSALESHRDCDIAHCKLKIINENDEPVKHKWDYYFIVRYFEDAIDKLHIRKAPHDGLLHFSGSTVYISLTQLLIRRKLFGNVGLFSTNYGPYADFEWGMRASLVANTIHVPEYLACWRRHDLQATDMDEIKISKAQGLFIKMAEAAFQNALEHGLSKQLKFNRLNDILVLEQLYYSGKNVALKFNSVPPFLVILLKNVYKLLNLENIQFLKNSVNNELKLKRITKLMREYFPNNSYFDNVKNSS